MKLSFFGAARIVTGSCYGISTEKEKILIDCGMFQGRKDIVRLNYEEFGFNPSEYEALVLTHAHLDHCGRIPKLVKAGFRGKIFSTDATKELAEVIMLDAVNISLQEVKHENRRRREQGLPPRKPLYQKEDVQRTMSLFRVVKYGEDVKISENITVKFYDAGHILGASSVQIKVNDGGKKKIISFSGDIGQGESIIVKNTEPIIKSDYVVMESTYGDRLHPKISDREKDFARVINETYRRGGKLMIPSFAVDRAQELLYSIKKLQAEGAIPKLPVFLDSPMAIKATRIFSRHHEYYNESISKNLSENESPFNFPGLMNTITTEQSKALNKIKKPCIIIAGNGMASAGRIKHHILNSIGNPNNTVLFVGYQAEGTLGYWLKKGEKKVRLLGAMVDVRAKIDSIDSFSAHADYPRLIAWLKEFSPKPKKIFIAHGEEKQSMAFSKRISLEGFENYIPLMNEDIGL